MPKVPFSLWTSFSTFGLIGLIDLQLYWIIRKKFSVKNSEYRCRTINSINPNIENGVVYA
jgi:hypothetical protein